MFHAFGHCFIMFHQKRGEEVMKAELNGFPSATFARRAAGLVVGLGLLSALATGCARAESAEANGRSSAPATTAAPASAEPDVATAKGSLAAGALLIDVRTPGEFEDGHPKQATNVPVDVIAARAPGLWPKDTKLVIACQSGRRATRAVKELRALGYASVTNGGSVESFESTP